MTILGFATWGLLGAFVYAGPRLLVSLSDSVTTPRAWVPWSEFGVGLIIGTIGAVGFAEVAAATLHQTSPADLRAIAVVLGMVANPVAPAIVHLVGENILHRLNAPLKPVKPRTAK